MLVLGPIGDDASRIALGFILRTARIATALQKIAPSLNLQEGCNSPVEAASAPARISFVYQLDDGRDQHDLTISSADYERTFEAQPDYQIVSASWRPASVNHVLQGPTFKITGNGKYLEVRYSMQSGPVYDRWRGWINGLIVTDQVHH
jgi:hypothetical protein